MMSAPRLAALVVCAATFACSGSDSGSDVTGSGDPSSAGSGTTGGTAAGQPADNGSSAPAPSGAAGGSGTSTNTGTSTGTGTNTGTGKGTATSPPVGCAAGAVTEVEANDTPDTANVIPAVTSTFCGTLPNVGDVDYITFTLPEDAKTIYFGRSWDHAVIGVEVTVDGSTFTVGSTPIFKPGAKYVIKVWIKGPGTATDYNVGIAITK